MPIIHKDPPVEINNPGSDAGGKTGSKRITDRGGVNYQWKQPILQNPKFIRKRKANYLDRENFGELLASRIAKALSQTPDCVPSVYFVTDNSNQRHLGIASEYLTANTIGTLDAHFLKGTTPKNVHHVKLVNSQNENQAKGHFNIDSNPRLKQGVADAIAISALVGDHDVNPGNMIVMTNNGQISIGRIDYGHAFKDLMRFPKFGGQPVHPNNILDFFNRETVDGRRSKSKLWRDYPGLVPSTEMVEALQRLTKVENMQEKIHTALEKVKNEVKQFIRDHTKDKEQIIKSFQTIAEHVSGEKCDKSSEAERIDWIFTQIENYAVKNYQQMQYAAEVMDLQLKIQNEVKDPNTTPQLDTLRAKYAQLVSETERGPFTWIKEKENSPAFQGDFDAFVQHRKNEEKLTALETQINDFLKTDQIRPAEKKHAEALLTIVKEPRKSFEDKISLVQDKLKKIEASAQPQSSLFSRLINSIRNFFTSTSTPSQNPNEKTTLAENTSGFWQFKQTLQEILTPETKAKEVSNHNTSPTPGSSL
jgi:hypothetical protein